MSALVPTDEAPPTRFLRFCTSLLIDEEGCHSCIWFHTSYMLSSDSWQAIALAGLVLSGFSGIASGPWAAVVFTMLYGGAVLSILRL